MPLSRAEHPNPFYVSNQPPLLTNPLVKLPFGAIEPRGWLGHQLELEKNGMAGHLHEVSQWLDYGHNGWVDPSIAGGWEELPYWLKGYGNLAYLSGDKAMIAEAKKWIDAMLATQEDNGWFGPKSLKTSIDDKYPDLWPHMLVLNVMQSWYEYSHDERVLPFMTKYFKWELDCPQDQFMKGYWPVMRVSDNVESIHWLYNRTKEPWLLDVATKVYKGGANWENSEKLPNWHGVNVAESFRAPTVYGEQSKNPGQLKGAEANYEKIRAMYGNYPGGGWGADENSRPGKDDPRQGFETCSIVELMHSFEMLSKISADPRWAERNEEVAFNLLPAAMTADQRGLRYLTAANMANADHLNKAPGIQNGGTMLSYSPFAVYRCCQHNHAMGWPYYAQHTWLATADGGLCASLYVPSKVTAKVGKDTASAHDVTIETTTGYPWADTIEFKVTGAAGGSFPLYLRMPTWTKNPTISINGKETPIKDVKQPGYVRITRTWTDGDTVQLKLPMDIEVKRWHANSAGVSYGPLDFSLAIGESYKPYNKDEKWPEYDLTAETPWNYGLVLSGTSGIDAAKSFEIKKKDGPIAENPFTHENSPISIIAKAKRIDGWGLDKNGLTQTLAPSPIKSANATEDVTLIPAGAARLRITAFPVIGDGPDAKPWPIPPKPAFTATASHVADGDSVDAVADGIEPKRSNDESIPRFTWWDHKGSVETIDATFEKPMTINTVSVYWFDDTGKGDCRAPASWKLLYKDGDAWKPVAMKGPAGVKLDQYNKASITPVTTTALRIAVELKPQYSGGILEWKVE